MDDGLQIDTSTRFLKLEFDGALSNKHIPVQFSGREDVSEIPSYTVDIVSNDVSMSADSILGHDVALVLTIGKLTRRFSGIVIRFSPGPLWGGGRGFRTYQLEVRPKLWLATLNARCRSFLNKSALDIVNSILSEYGVSAKTRGPGEVTRPVRDYCLQYCESDYNFIARLLESEGLYFYFPLDHQNNSLVIVDGVNGWFEVDENQLKAGPHESISNWAQDFLTIPQGVTYTGYDFKQADVVTGTVTSAKSLSYASRAKIEAYSSNVLDTPRSQAFADWTMQRHEKDYETFRGDCRHPKLAPGGRFTIGAGDPMAGGSTVMVLEAEHAATCYTHVSGEGGAPEYINHFRCCPLDTKYRPPHRAVRPVIHGPQTATVSSDPDEYGRIKVKFHWGNQLESWWTRVAMPWAHNQMGFQFLPRLNSEVVVEFLDGNPERPIVVGAVYNGVKKVVYALPDNKTQSGMRGTDPDKTGAPEALNELQFEDKDGSEFIKFFAKKDFDRIVVNKDGLEVRQGDRTVTLKQGNLSTILDQGNETRDLKMGNLTTTLDQGNETRELKLGNLTLKLGTGNQSTKLDLGASTTEAMQSIQLKVGGSSITIDQTGVTIKGMMISIEGEVQTQVKGLMTQINGDAMLQLKGGITMIG